MNTDVAQINFQLKKSNADERSVKCEDPTYTYMHTWTKNTDNITSIFSSFTVPCDLFLQRQVLAYEDALTDKVNKIKILYIKYHWQLKWVSYIQWVSDVSLLADNMNQNKELNVFSVHYLP
jgi:hypothetical protein